MSQVIMQEGDNNPKLIDNMEKTVLVTTRYPAGLNPICRGRSSDLSLYCAFPVVTSGKEYNKFPRREGLTATGIVPDSHRIPF